MAVPARKVKASKVTNVGDLEAKIKELVVGDGKDLDAYFNCVATNIQILNTKAKLHCHTISHDGNDRPRVKDLARAVAAAVIDYSIPRSEILEAHNHMIKTRSTVKWTELAVKARQLFTSLSQTGEGGEMLLYLLTQTFLGLPQVMCKMPLKTSKEMHFHGSDGIYAQFDNNTQKLSLYWGESKLYTSIDNAISKCLDSLKPFLIDDGGTDSAQERDLQLFRDNIDLCDPLLEQAFLNYLNPKSPTFKKLEYRGVCLIGFDETSYPKKPNTKTESDVLNEIKMQISSWEKKVRNRIINRTPLETFVIEVFLIPFPSVDDFREAFLKEISYAL